MEAIKTPLMTKIKEFFFSHYKFILALAIAIITCTVAMSLYANLTMSPAEGWYSYFAYMINEQGAIPYVDFELLFPPVYVYFIALFTKIFGYEIMALRVLGVIIFAVKALFLFLTFYELFKNEWIACFVAIFITTFSTTETQVSYDYICVMDMCVFIAIYCFVKYFNTMLHRDKSQKYKFSPAILVSGIFCILAFLLKQSSGVMYLALTVVVFIVLLIVREDKKNILLDMLTYFGIMIFLYAVMLLLLATGGAVKNYFYYNFSAAGGAKGGLFAVLFDGMARSMPYILKQLPAAIIFIAVMVAEIFLNKFLPDNKAIKTIYPVILGAISFVGILLTIILPQIHYALDPMYKTDIQYMAFSVNIVILVYLLIVLFRKRFTIFDESACYKTLFVSAAGFILTYAVTMSGGFGQSQTILGIGVMFAVALYLAKFKFKQIFCLLLALFMALFTCVFYSEKATLPYSWWGLNTGANCEQTYELDLPCVKGLKVNKKFYDMYNGVYTAVTENSNAGDNVFMFPHVPILYLMTDRHSETTTKVQWFDVSTDATVVSDIQKLKDNPPKVIVFCEVPEWAIQGHEASFRKDGAKSGLNQMQAYLKETFESTSEYTNVCSYPLSDEYVVSVYVHV